MNDALQVLVQYGYVVLFVLLLIVGAALASCVAIKFIQRQRFLRSLRIARITPDELRHRLDAGDGDLVVIDARSALEVGSHA